VGGGGCRFPFRSFSLPASCFQLFPMCYLWRVLPDQTHELLAVVAEADVYRFIYKNPCGYAWQVIR